MSGTGAWALPCVGERVLGRNRDRVRERNRMEGSG